MSELLNRRAAFQAALAGALAFGAGESIAEIPLVGGAGTPLGIRSFDFFLGSWNVHHRRLRKRLAGSNEWDEFEGTTKCQSLLGGIINLNESASTRGGKAFRGMGLRAFDAKTDRWADWTFSEASPFDLGTPGIGRFENGVGTFLSDEEYEGRPVRVRGRFTPISTDEAQWEQAFSPDGGRTWETNWVMHYSRTR